MSDKNTSAALYIEDYPFIIRFKTPTIIRPLINVMKVNIEDYPFIIRFKTAEIVNVYIDDSKILKIIHL